MRFEDSAMKTLRIDAGQFDDLRRSGRTADDSNAPGGDARQFSEKADDRLVRLAIHRRRGDVELPTVSVRAREFGAACAGADFKRESGFH
jgi:hypothetical protein